MLALAAPVNVAAIVPVRVVGPTRTRKTSLPGEVNVVTVPAAVTRKLVPAANSPAGTVAPTTWVSVLAMAAEAARLDAKSPARGHGAEQVRR